MTANDVAWLKARMENKLGRDTLAETKRSNQAKESETYRSNVAKEQENYRSNVARETETNRSNLTNEAISQRKTTIDEAKLRSDPAGDETFRAYYTNEGALSNITARKQWRDYNKLLTDKATVEANQRKTEAQAEREAFGKWKDFASAVKDIGSVFFGKGGITNVISLLK